MSEYSEKVVYQKLVSSQIKGGFLDLLKEAQIYFPRSDTSIRVQIFFDDEANGKSINLTGWRHRTPMLTGLKQWFTKNGANPDDTIAIEVLGDNTYRMKLIKSEKKPPMRQREVAPIQVPEKMKVNYFDYRDASSVLKAKSLLTEIQRILRLITKVDHKEIQQLFLDEGWETEKKILPEVNWAWDAYKEGIIVSTEFSLIDAVHRDFFRLLMWHQDGKVDAVVYITSNLKEPRFDNVKRDIEICQRRYPSLLPTPILLIGLG